MRGGGPFPSERWGAAWSAHHRATRAPRLARHWTARPLARRWRRHRGVGMQVAKRTLTRRLVRPRLLPVLPPLYGPVNRPLLPPSPPPRVPPPGGALSSMGLDEMLFAASEGSGGGADADEAARIDDAMAKAREAHVARKAALMRAQKADTWLSSAPPAAGKRRFGGVGVGKADERDTGGFINFAGAMKVSKTVANKEGMHRAGQLLIPKFDNPAGERIWPPPEIRLRGDPKDRDFKWDWAKARGSYWRKFMDVIPEHELTRNWTYGTCAVVGNGGSLTMWDLGEEIDSHDAVIRFNRGPTAGFQKHVGNRTTVRIVNRNNLGTIHDGDEAVLQHVTAPEAFRAFVKFREEDRDKPVYAIDPEFHKDVLQWYMKWLTASGARTNDQSPATNGFYGIIFAVQRCQRISLYGFARLWGAGRHNEGAAFPMQLPYHYFDEEEPRGMQKTRDDIEMKVLRHLVNTRKQSVRFAEPCGSGCERECERCPPGGQCMCDIWHPVPIAGFCLSPSSQHRANKGVLRGVMDCFHKCVDRHACPGGVHGICPGDTSLYRTECATFEDLVQ
mmetsp:Transcript_69862/g.221343  ORF Transcript_69862/g.221343 Transcript_69862/m.221343 type:complete len:560 (-) Transcript_69862:25-1704(-)